MLLTAHGSQGKVKIVGKLPETMCSNKSRSRQSTQNKSLHRSQVVTCWKSDKTMKSVPSPKVHLICCYCLCLQVFLHCQNGSWCKVFWHEDSSMSSRHQRSGLSTGSGSGRSTPATESHDGDAKVEINDSPLPSISERLGWSPHPKKILLPMCIPNSKTQPEVHRPAFLSV